MFLSLRRSVLFLLLSLFLLCGVYPAFVTLVAQVLFPEKAEGSLIISNGVVLGSHLIGQAYQSPAYFWGRPSATPDYPTNGLSSRASNVAVYSKEYVDTIANRLSTLQILDQTVNIPAPLDLVSGSASGLDPDISKEAALYQAHRVANARGLDSSAVIDLIERLAEKPSFGFLGTERVNVLLLNLSLDGKI